MMDWMKILAAGALGLMVFVSWRGYRWWSEHSPKAKEGDWNSALLALAAVAAFVGLLILMVRS